MKRRQLRDGEVVKPETLSDTTVTCHNVPMASPGILERVGETVIERRHLRTETYPVKAIALVTEK